MPETVLQGPDGQAAVDQSTGMPLTMEELMRRRGILAVGGNSRLMPFADPQPTTGDSNPSSVAAAMRKRSGIPTKDNGDGAATDSGNGTGGPSVETLAAQGKTPAQVRQMELMGAVATGTATALGYYLASRVKGRGKGPDAKDFGAGGTGSGGKLAMTDTAPTNVKNVGTVLTPEAAIAGPKMLPSAATPADFNVVSDPANQVTGGLQKVLKNHMAQQLLSHIVH